MTEYIQTKNVPRLRVLIANHFKDNRSVSSLVLKLEKASSITVHGVTGNFRSGFSARATRSSEGNFDPEYIAAAQLSFLAWKLGCGQLLRTQQITSGALGKTILRQRIKREYLFPTENWMNPSLSDRLVRPSSVHHLPDG